MTNDLRGPRLEFEVQVGDDRGSLFLRPGMYLGWLFVEELELQALGDGAARDVAGIERLRSHRFKVSRARVSVDDAGLQAALGLRARALGSAGFEDLTLRAIEGCLEVGGRVRCGGSAAELSGRLQVDTTSGADGELRLRLTELRVFGHVRRPAPLLGHELLCALVGPAARVAGLADIRCAPLRAFLDAAFPAAGWPVPDVTVAAQVSVSRGLLAMRCEAGSTEETLEPKNDGDEALLAGDFDRALVAYRAELQARPGRGRFLVERILSVLTARDATLGEAETVAREALARWSDHPAGHLALAQLAVFRGDIAAAADGFGRVGDLAERAGNDEEAVRALLACARRLRELDPARATAAYERVLARRPGHTEVADVLAERYDAERRWAQLARLLYRRLGVESDAAEKAVLCRRLGCVLLEHLGDAGRAKETLSRAVELSPDAVPGWDLLAHACEAAGDDAGSVQALEHLVRLSVARGDGVGEASTRMRLAALRERIGDDEGAAAEYRRLIGIAPDHVDALERLALVAGRLGLIGEAQAAFTQVLEICPGQDERARRARRELVVLCSQSGDLNAAMRYLQWPRNEGSPACDDDPDLLFVVAAIHEQEGRIDAAAEALARASALVTPDRAAEIELRRAGILGGMGREAEAAEALERACAAEGMLTESASARRVMACARALGHAWVEARSIDAVLGLSEDIPDRAELLLRRAELVLGDGDPAGARAVLDSAVAAGADGPAARRLLVQVLSALGDAAGRVALLQIMADDADPAEQPTLRAGVVHARLSAGDPQGALQAARDALARHPGHRALLRALGEAAFAAASWPDVIAAYGLLLSEAEPTEAVEWLRRSGIAFDQMGQPAEAQERFRAAIDVPEASGEPLQAAWLSSAELHERMGDHDRAAEAFAAFAADPRTGTAPQARAELHYRAAMIFRDQLGVSELAQAELEAGLSADGRHEPSLDALEAIHGAAGDDLAVAAVLRRKADAAEEPARRAVALARLAEVCARLGLPEEAHAAWQGLAQVAPEHTGARRFLADAALRRGDLLTAERCLLVLRELAAGGGGEIDAALVEVKARRARMLLDGGDVSGAALEAARSALERTSGDARLIALCAEAARAAGDSSAEVDYLGQLRAAAVTGVRDLSRLGELLEAGHEKALALQVRTEALALHLAALADGRLDDFGAELATAVAALARAAPDPGPALSVLVEAAGRAADDAVAAAWLREAAEVRRSVVDDPAGAAELLTLALKRTPADGAIVASLVPLLRELGEWRRLVEAYELHLPTCSEEQRPQLLHEIGRIWANQLGDPDRAAPFLVEARALGRVDNEEGVQHLLHVLETLSPSEVTRIARTRQKLGELFLRLGNPNRARKELELVIADEPRCAPALMSLSEIYASAGLWARAAETLDHLARLVNGRERADLLFRLGEIRRAHLDDEEGAWDAYLKAIDLDQRHVPTLRRLIDYYWGLGDHPSLLEIAAELDRQRGLLVPESSPETLARVGVSAGLAGDAARGTRMARALGTAGAGAMALALAEAAARTPSADGLVVLARALCEPPGPPLQAVREVLAARGLNDMSAAELAREL